MNNQEIISELKTIIKPYAQDQIALENISGSTDFVKDLKINSANLIDIILDVESRFNIVVDDESIEKMLTVGAAVDLIRQKAEQNGRE
ncbi:MAG TPA: acyl carrier protein [Ignavibacteriaceae bacterium]|nr:acyl carrier protein [Ignavibacteriaceae bacterium]